MTFLLLIAIIGLLLSFVKATSQTAALIDAKQHFKCMPKGNP